MTKIRWPALLLILALHMALVVSWTIQRQRAAVQHGERVAIQWLLPLQPRPGVARPEPKQVRRAAPAPTLQRDAVPPAPAPSRAQASTEQQPAPAAPQAAAPLPIAQPRADDPFAQPAPNASAADIMRQAARDVAKIDQELRKGAPIKPLTLQQDSTQAKLERGFNAAHDAVLPKWYEGAKITELPSSNPHQKIFRIRTALGDYCIYLSEEGKKNYANCPR
jgi:hypothetical protein